MLNEIFRIAAITALLIIALQFLKVAKKGKNLWLSVAFTMSVVCYLIVDWRGEIHPILFSILLAGPLLLPLLFWLLSKSIFDDHFRMTVPFYVLIFVFLLVQFTLFYNPNLLSFSPSVEGISLLIPKVLSFVFILLGVAEAVRNRKYDLIDARLRFRNTFIVVTAVLIGVTLIVESIGLRVTTPEILPTIQKGAIALLAFIFIFFNQELIPDFFIRSEKKEKPKNVQIESSRIVEKITRLLEDEKIYRTEGLTISLLSEMLKEQEYRVRRTINGQLGFRNFNDFLNKYRVQEACVILQNPEKSDLTILEIAYSLGYQSIGPFNKAFKDQTGVTPTLYRKQKIQ